ncbi:MAG: hypothetical protein J1F09_09610, partial [Oscillospiraceae bacterium]|nr:hypothetical protein [Oscillospiraceae bacterium]
KCPLFVRLFVFPPFPEGFPLEHRVYVRFDGNKILLPLNNTIRATKSSPNNRSDTDPKQQHQVPNKKPPLIRTTVFFYN